MIQRLYEAEVRYSGLKKTTAENNPILLSLKTEIEDMRPGILENIRNQMTSLIASRAKLTMTNDKYAYALTTIPQKEKELLEANRQQLIKNNVIIFTSKKGGNDPIGLVLPWSSRLVDKAEASILPVSPKKIFVFGGAFAFPVFL